LSGCSELQQQKSANQSDEKVVGSVDIILRGFQEFNDASLDERQTREVAAIDRSEL